MIYLFQVSVCTAIFYAAYYFLFEGKTNHVFNRFYLLGSLLSSLLIPILEIPVYPQQVYLFSTESVERIMTVSASGIQEKMTWEDWLMMLYFIGVTLHLGILLRRLNQIAQIIRKGKIEKKNAYVKVITDGDIPLSSFLFYLFIPVEKENNITSFEIEHEKIHITQRHSLDILFVELFQAFFWINPLVFFYKKNLKEVHEYLADQESIYRFGNEKYESFLIQQISQQQRSLTSNFHSLFKQRIKMIHTDTKTQVWQYTFLLPMIAFALSLFSFTHYPVYQFENEHNLMLAKDTFPPISRELEEKTLSEKSRINIPYYEQYSYINSHPEYDPFEIDTDEILIKKVHPIFPSTRFPINQFKNEHNAVLANDTFPPIPPDLEGKILDTVITFDADTYTETVEYFESSPNKDHTSTMNKGYPGEIDTLVIFNPTTFEETMITINNTTGVRDTID